MCIDQNFNGVVRVSSGAGAMDTPASSSAPTPHSPVLIPGLHGSIGSSYRP